VSDDEGQPDLSAFGAESDATDGEADSVDATAADAADAAAGGDADATDPGADGEPAGRSDGERTGRDDDGGWSNADVADLGRSERIELAVDLLAHLEADELPLSAVVDRIETVTTNPSLTREILDTAELRGVIERDGGRIHTRRGGTFVRFESRVVRREGDFDCRRCGAGLSTGHFVRFESGELGPFGSSCVRKVLGRD
jgi:hypothetical protein